MTPGNLGKEVHCICHPCSLTWNSGSGPQWEISICLWNESINIPKWSEFVILFRILIVLQGINHSLNQNLMVLKADTWTDICITIFIASFFTIAQKVDATQMFTYE